MSRTSFVRLVEICVVLMIGVAPPARGQVSPPEIACPPEVDVSSPDGQPVNVKYGYPTIIDGISPVHVSCTPRNGSLFPLGATPAVCRATDALGHTSRCTINVVVSVDAPPPPPSIACPAAPWVQSPDGQPVVVTFGNPTVSDGAPPVTTSCSPASGSLFSVGSTPVSCTARDALQRSASCSFNATVTNGSSGGGGLLQPGNLQYVGAFRLPDGTFGSENGFSFGGGPMAYDASVNGLYVGGHPYDSMVAEVSVPTPVQSGDVNALPFASVVQDFADPTEGQQWALVDDMGGSVILGGLLVSGGRLFGTAYVYYDADGLQQASHYSRSLNLAQPSATPFYQVGTPVGYVSGYLAEVPADWQGSLGGPAVTGQCCIPIVSRTSWGPDLYGWNPADLTQGATAQSLFFYTGDHPTLGQWQGSNGVYGGTTQMGGVAIVAGSRTALFFGANGTGPFCYGTGTDDESLVGQENEDGDYYCYDPTNFSKAQHAFPYNYQVWAYDLNDMVDVRSGRKSPWDVVPYAVWTLDLPFPASGSWAIAGVAYDPQRQLIFLSQPYADPDGYAFRPVIHVFRVAQ